MYMCVFMFIVVFKEGVLWDPLCLSVHFCYLASTAGRCTLRGVPRSQDVLGLMMICVDYTPVN